MPTRTTLILTFFTALLGSWILWVEPRLKTTATLDWESRNLITFSPQACVEIEFKIPDHVFRLRRGSDENFFLETPGPTIQANETLVTKVLGRFGNLNRTSILPLQCPPEIDLASFLERYDLKTPKVILSFSFRDGVHQRVSFGKQETEQCYVRINESPEIQILPLELLHLATPTLDDLRDPHVIRFDPVSLMAIQIQQEGKTIHLEKTVPSATYDHWRQTEPLRFPVDSDTLFILLDTLSNQLTQHYLLFAELEASLSNPLFQITCWSKIDNKKQTSTLHLYQKDQLLYTHIPQTPWIRAFQNDALLATLQLPAWKYLERDLLPFRDPDRLTFLLPENRQFSYERNDKQWWKKNTTSDSIPIPVELLQPILETLQILQMLELVAWEPTSLTEYGLDAPRQQWSLSQGEQTILVKIGIASNADTFYATREDFPVVFTLNKEILATLALRLGECDLYLQNYQLQQEVKEQFSTPEKK